MLSIIRLLCQFLGNDIMCMHGKNKITHEISHDDHCCPLSTVIITI